MIRKVNAKPTIEKQMNLKVNPTLIPNWKQEIENAKNELKKLDWSKVQFAVNKVMEIKKRDDFYRSYYSISRYEDHSKNDLKTLASLAEGKEIEWGYFESWNVKNILDLTIRDSENMIDNVYSKIEYYQKQIEIIMQLGTTKSRLISLVTKKKHLNELYEMKSNHAKWCAPQNVANDLLHVANFLSKTLFTVDEKCKTIDKLQKLIEKAHQKIEATRKFEKKHGKILAKAATVDNKTRNRINKMKLVVDKTSKCPYCNRVEMDNPHLDHIYPVSKGGLSILENLVWCCSSCNHLKSDKGLVEFLLENNYPMNDVFLRLRGMGKHV